MPDQTVRFKSAAKDKELFHFMGTSTFSQYTVLPEISVAVVSKQVVARSVQRDSVFSAAVSLQYIEFPVFSVFFLCLVDANNEIVMRTRFSAADAGLCLIGWSVVLSICLYASSIDFEN